MQLQKTCPVCSKQYWPNQQWIHDKCSQSVTTNIVQVEPIRSGPVVTVTMCSHCVTKDKEIERLHNQLVEAVKKAVVIEELKPKRDRAEYMRKFRERKRDAQGQR